MNKFFHKTLQHSVGITGLFIVYLGISLVPDFLYNLWTFALSHPLSGGLATGLPLIPLLMSSKQKRILQMTDVILHSDISATSALVIDQTIEHYLSGWVQKVSYNFAYETPFNQMTHFAGWSYVKDDRGGVYNTDIDDYSLTDVTDQMVATGVTYNRMPIRPIFETYFHTYTKGDTIVKHENTMMEWVDPGDEQVVQLAAIGDVDPTGGEVTIRIEVTVIIAAFGVGKSSKQSNPPNFLIILGKIAGASGQTRHTIMPETDMRLFSMRGTLNQLTMDDETYMAIYKGQLDPNDFLTTTATFTDVILQRRNMFFVGNHPDHSSDSTTTDQEQFLGVTRFRKGPLFMKKAQPWTWEVNNESGNPMYVSFSAQVMPDYQNAVDWNVNLTPDVSGDGWTYFTIPYDMYVTQINWDYKFTVINTETGNTDQEVYIQGIKSGQSAHSTALEGFLQYPNGSTAQDALRTASLENIYITAPPADVYGGGTGKTTSYSQSGNTQVNDYYERGSKIGIANSAITTISDFGFMLHIEGVVAKKTGKRDALGNKYQNPEIFDYDTLEAVTL